VGDEGDANICVFEDPCFVHLDLASERFFRRGGEKDNFARECLISHDLGRCKSATHRDYCDQVVPTGVAQLGQSILLGVESDYWAFAFAIKDCLESCFDSSHGAGYVPPFLILEERCE
jgi:hypothetical protein